ncbi:hypothetical protein Ancab_011276 [Ancistrocladus abbreviatus]
MVELERGGSSQRTASSFLCPETCNLEQFQSVDMDQEIITFNLVYGYHWNHSEPATKFGVKPEHSSFIRKPTD